MTRNEAFFQYVNHAETWDRKFQTGYTIRMTPVKERDIVTEQLKNFFRVEIERTTPFSVNEERILMDMSGFVALLPGIPGENKVVRFEFEFGEK